jgi:hypothetical protein
MIFNSSRKFDSDVLKISKKKKKIRAVGLETRGRGKALAIALIFLSPILLDL